MTFWRAAGLTYINYSTIAARATREALKKGDVFGLGRCKLQGVGFHHILKI